MFAVHFPTQLELFAWVTPRRRPPFERRCGGFVLYNCCYCRVRPHPHHHIQLLNKKHESCSELFREHVTVQLALLSRKGFERVVRVSGKEALDAAGRHVRQASLWGSNQNGGQN